MDESCALDADDAEVCGPPAERLAPSRRDADRLAAHHIACLREVLVRMDDEEHVLFENGTIIRRDIARCTRSAAEAMSAPSHMRRTAILTVACRLENPIDAAAHLRNRDPGTDR